MIEIRQITKENAGDLNLKNEPFEMPGRFIPALENGQWSYRTEAFDTMETMCFPDENYDFDEIAPKGIIFGAYEDGKCIGVAIYQDHWLKYMYLYDLKVGSAARGKGVGKRLIAAGMQAAKERGYRGLYTYAQDNNLNACMFYLAAGFQIGGFDNRVYTGTSQAGKADVIFYKE
ncbi:MAG: GNAT family N-acetyltransferase [Oscillospiraceae bacterium]|nr:GNAT family N-acetyltransferase [Oscillospiraceae bacterium]